MYKQFYHLQAEPFSVTPDPSHFFASPSHREALAALIYGIESRRGFIAIVGEVGLGKTTVIRAYLESRRPENLHIIYLFNPNLSFEDLVHTVAVDLGIVRPSEDLHERIAQLYLRLIEIYREGGNVALIIDEAQNVPHETLENLRLLSNLETAEDKLLQIVLVGQPELLKKLGTEGLRQLKQRIAIHHTIMPLSRKESFYYIQYRLVRSVAPRGGPIFTVGALRAVVRAAKGVPRLINIYCSNALVAGFAYQKKPVTRKIVREVVRGFEPSSGTRWWKWGFAVGGILLLGLSLAWMSSLDKKWILQRTRQMLSAGGRAVETQPAAGSAQMKTFGTPRSVTPDSAVAAPHPAARITGESANEATELALTPSIPTSVSDSETAGLHFIGDTATNQVAQGAAASSGPAVVQDATPPLPGMRQSAGRDRMAGSDPLMPMATVHPGETNDRR